MWTRNSRARSLCALSLTLTAAALTWPTQAAAQPKSCKDLTLDRSEVTISGVLGDADSFVGTFRVTAGKEKLKPVFLPAGDLKTKEAGGPVIGEGKIDVANPAEALPENEPREVRVSVKDVRFAGEYHGRLELAGGRCKIALTVVVAGAADLGLIGSGDDKAAKLHLVRCKGLACGPSDFARSLVSDLSRRDSVTVQVDNASQTPAQITDVQIALRGDPNERLLPSGAIVMSRKDFELGSQGVSSLPAIDIDRNRITPDHYTGAIYLTVAGAEKRTVLPFEVDMKDGPFWASIALLIALFVQFLVWLASRNKPRKEALRELRAVEKQVAREDEPLLDERLAAARQLVLNGELEAAKTAREAIARDAGRLKEARELEQEAIRKAGSVPAGIAALLRELRQAAGAGEDATANSKLNDVRREVGGLPEPVTVVTPTLGELYSSYQETLPKGGLLTMTTDSGPSAAGNIVAGLTAVVVFVRHHARGILGLIGASIASVRQKARNAVVLFSVYPLPWILRGLLVILFVFAGLKELYYDDDTFGAQVVLDYGALFLWGLSATAVNKALGKIIPGQE